MNDNFVCRKVRFVSYYLVRTAFSVVCIDQGHIVSDPFIAYWCTVCVCRKAVVYFTSANLCVLSTFAYQRHTHTHTPSHPG